MGSVNSRWGFPLHKAVEYTSISCQASEVPCVRGGAPQPRAGPGAWTGDALGGCAIYAEDADHGIRWPTWPSSTMPVALRMAEATVVELTHTRARL
eukprot:1822187-Prymnesium_polylepis.1